MVGVLLIEPTYGFKERGLLIRKSAEFFSGSPVALREPIAAEYVAGYLRFKGISVDVVQQITTTDEEMLAIIEMKNPKVLGISIHSTHIFPIVLDFLKKCKSKFPNIIVVCGGNHPTCVPEIVGEKCIDYVVRGEGEETFYELTSAILNDKSTESICGISLFEEEHIIHNLPRRRFDFSKSPWPIRKMEILQGITCAPLAYPPPPKQRCAAQISYSRGCPFRCDFCVSPLVFPGKVIHRDADDVIKEIKYLQHELGTNFLFFTDLTFNAIPRKANKLCEKIVENNLKIHWFAYCDMHLEENTTKKMAEAGCTRIGTGAESLIESILKAYKSQNKLSDIKRTLELTDKYGILNRVYLMFGYPEETREMLKEATKKMKTLPIDQPRLAFITPFPGTVFYKKFEDALVTKDLEKFTGDFPVLKNASGFSPKEYINFRNTAIKEFYNSKEYITRVGGKCTRFPHLVESYRYYFDYLKNKKILKQTIYSKFLSMISSII